MTKNDAQYYANTLGDGYKKVIDGQYAILNDKKEGLDLFYIRKDNKWVFDEVINENDFLTFI